MKRIISLVLVLILSLGVLAGCQLPFGPETPDAPTYDLANAKGYLKDLYPNLLPTKEVAVPSTIANFNVTKVLGLKDGKYTVAWSTNVESVQVVDYVPSEEGDIFNADNTATVKVVMGSEDVNYTLTATITAPDGSTDTVNFNLVVPKLDCNTHEEYMAAKSDEELMVLGVVVAINSVKLGNKYNHVFLADTTVDGGYYCYKLAADPAELGVQVGMTVAVSGKMSPYSGMQEIKDGQLVIIDESIKEVAPLDITDKFTAGENLAKYVALPVTIKGVEIGTQDLTAETSQYLYFSIGEQKGYVRTYVTDFPAGMLEASDKATIDADHAAHFGFKADVTGILILYNSAPYLIPMSVTPFTNYQEVIKTPAEKVASEKENLKVSTSFSADAVVTLPLVGANYEDVTITWTSNNEAIAIAEDGTATITVPDTKTVVTLTATLTCGDATDTKVIEVTLDKKALTAGQVNEMGAAMEHNVYTTGKYLIAGVVTEVYNDQYGNMKITDELGNILTVYGTYSADGSTRYDAMETKPVAGDYVVLLGVIGQYNGTPQTKNAWILSWTSPTTIPAANEIGTNNPNYTEEKYLVTGTVTEVANATYGNLYIEDAEGNKLYLYGLYDQLGNRYDAMTTAPAVGDVITVLTALGAYKDAPQGKNATLVAHTVNSTPDQGGEEDDGTIKTGDQVVIYAPAYNMALSATKVATYYNQGVDVSAGFDSLTDAEKWIVTINADGTYTFTSVTGDVLALAADYSSLNVEGEHKTWALEPKEGAEGIFYLKNVGRGNYLEWYASKNNWSTYATTSLSDLFELSFYRVGSEGGTTPPSGGEEGGETTGPKEVSLTEAATLADGTEVIVSGHVISADEWNADFGNMSVTIEDASGATLYIYRLSTQVTVGDIITVTGKVGSYNGSKQIAQGATAVVTGHEDIEKPEVPATGTYVKVTNAADFTTGTYVLVLANGYAPSHLDGSWVASAQPTVSGNNVTDAAGATWLITVEGSSATLTDKNGTNIAPKGGNNNGITAGSYKWDWAMAEDGTVTFKGTGSDTVIFAFNSDSQYLKFRAYKSSTVTGQNASTYPCAFEVYKLVTE